MGLYCVLLNEFLLIELLQCLIGVSFLQTLARALRQAESILRNHALTNSRLALDLWRSRPRPSQPTVGTNASSAMLRSAPANPVKQLLCRWGQIAHTFPPRRHAALQVRGRRRRAQETRR